MRLSNRRHDDFRLKPLDDLEQRETDILHYDSDGQETDAASRRKSSFPIRRSPVRNNLPRRHQSPRRMSKNLPSSTSTSPCHHHVNCDVQRRQEQPHQSRSDVEDIENTENTECNRRTRRTKSNPMNGNKIFPRQTEVATMRQEMTSSSPAILRSSRFQVLDRPHCNDDDSSGITTKGSNTYSNHQRQRASEVNTRSLSSTPIRPVAESRRAGAMSAVNECSGENSAKNIRSLRARANWSKLRDQYRKPPQAPRYPSRISSAPRKPVSKTSAAVPSKAYRTFAVARNEDEHSVLNQNSANVSAVSDENEQVHYLPASSVTSGHHSVSFQKTSTVIKPVVGRVRSAPSAITSDNKNDERHCQPPILPTMSPPGECNYDGNYGATGDSDIESSFGSSARKPEIEKRSVMDNEDLIASRCHFEANIDGIECDDDDRVRQFSNEFDQFDFDESGRPLNYYDPFSFQNLSTEHEGKVTVPIVICLVIIAGYIFGGAVLFTLWEDWDYLTGSYFCFITLSTIGFGDIVPGTDMDKWASHEKLVLCVLWLAFGLSLLAMCFNLMQEEVKDKCRWIGLRVGLLRDDEER